MWYKGKQIASKMNGVQFQRTDTLRSFWVHSKVGIAFTLAHMLNTRFKEYYISNICEIMAFQPAKTEKYSQIPKMETYDSLTFIMNIHSVIHLSSIHPSIHQYLLGTDVCKVLSCTVTTCDVKILCVNLTGPQSAQIFGKTWLWCRDFPGGPVTKIPWSQCKRPRIQPGSLVRKLDSACHNQGFTWCT